MVVGGVFGGDSWQWKWGVPDSLPVLGIVFFPQGYLALPRCEGLCLILLYLVVLCSVAVCGRPAFFGAGRCGGVDRWGQLGGIKEGKLWSEYIV